MASPHEGFDGYRAIYSAERGLGAFVHVLKSGHLPINEITSATGLVHELRMIDGYPAVVAYALTGYAPSMLGVYDESTGIEYFIVGYAWSLSRNIDAVIDIARSLLPE